MTDDRRRGGRRRARAAVSLPPITYPPDLPVSARVDDIATAIRDHQVVIVAGATGSGKTTQIPKIALDLGRGRAGQIGHTQPRRIAARTVAERISYELGVELGTAVGYQVRFTDTTSAETLVRVMTDGVLLAQIQRDPDLRDYDTLIIDEAHERSLNIDFILGYLTRLLPRRPDLKVIITSATIDSQRFAAHFAEAIGSDVPVVEVSGRTYPVEIRYRPLADEADITEGVLDAVDELVREGPGDILAFFSGEREIRDAADALTGHVQSGWLHGAVEILPLYGRLSAAEQHRVFAPHVGRRIVLATNVAETSLTVPGVHYVIDTGTARISRYSKATKVQRLPIEPISQASANQRSGRSGRVADGIAIRLYSEADYLSRPEYTEPEILRTSLASVILHMIAAGVATSADDVVAFPFLDPPDTRAVRDGVALLRELGALQPTTAGLEQSRSRRGRRSPLTPVGRALTELPIDPRLARMIVAGGGQGVAREVIVIAAALSIQDPRERPTDRRAEADAMHARFADPRSDFLAYLNLWEYLRAAQRQLSGSAFRRRVKSEYLNYLRIREWQDLVTQLREAARPAGVTVLPPTKRHRITVTERHIIRTAASGAAAYAVETEDTEAYRLDWEGDAIHRALLAGLLANIGVKDSDLRREEPRGERSKKRRKGPVEYAGTRGTRFAIFPGSPVSKHPPEVVMAAELVETSRLWARDVAAIQAEWVEEVGAHLVRRSYVDPGWSGKRGAAMVTEKVTLLGVPLVADRRVLLAKIDPEAARDTFIRRALVEGDWRTHHEFFARNTALLADANDLANRARRRDVVVDDEDLVRFYDERVPDHVVSAAHFDSWWKKARRTNPDLLTFTPRMLLTEAAGTLASADYPSVWRQGDLKLAMTYEFDPGSAQDGLVVHIPITQLGRVRPDGFDWLIPGLRTELVAALIRTLPKPLRTPLVPAADMARRIVAELPPGPETDPDAPPLTEAISDVALRLVGVKVPPDAFTPERLPAHLRLTYRVDGEREAVDGTNLIELQRRLAPEMDAAVRTAVRAALRAAGPKPAPGPKAPDPKPSSSPPVTETPVTTWPQGADLSAISSGDVTAHPGLVETPSGIVWRLQADAGARDRNHHDAVRALLASELALATARVTSRWSSTVALALAVNPYPSTDALVSDLQRAAVDSLLAGRTPGTAREYEAVQAELRDTLEDEVLRIAIALAPVLEAARDLDLALAGPAGRIRPELADWLHRLIRPGFVAEAGAARLPHLRRYLRAATVRLGKPADHKDASLAAQVADLENEYLTVRAAHPQPTLVQREALNRARWLLEELRVSLFAQTLGTAEPVSAKRIRAALAAV